MKRIKNTVTFKLTAKEEMLFDHLSAEEPEAFYVVDLMNVNWDEPFITLTYYDIDDLEKFDYEMQKLIRYASKYDKRVVNCRAGLSLTVDSDTSYNFGLKVIKDKLEEAGFDVKWVDDIDEGKLRVY